MGFSWCAHVQQRLKGMTSGHMYTAWWPYGKHMWMSNGHEVEAWWMDMRQTHCCSTDHDVFI